VRRIAGEPRRGVEVLVVWEEHLDGDPVPVQRAHSMVGIAKGRLDEFLESGSGTMALSESRLEDRLRCLRRPSVLVRGEEFLKSRLELMLEVGTVVLGLDAHVTIRRGDEDRLVR
jgi:hypothetical protein